MTCHSFHWSPPIPHSSWIMRIFEYDSFCHASHVCWLPRGDIFGSTGESPLVSSGGGTFCILVNITFMVLNAHLLMAPYPNLCDVPSSSHSISVQEPSIHLSGANGAEWMHQTGKVFLNPGSGQPASPLSIPKNFQVYYHVKHLWHLWWWSEIGYNQT